MSQKLRLPRHQGKESESYALFHIAEWLSDGFPSDALNAAAQIVGVVLVGFVGVGLALWRAQQEGADHVQGLSAQEDRRDGARIRL